MDDILKQFERELIFIENSLGLLPWHVPIEEADIKFFNPLNQNKNILMDHFQSALSHAVSFQYCLRYIALLGAFLLEYMICLVVDG